MEVKTIKQWLLKAKEQGYEWADEAIANAEYCLSANELSSLVSSQLVSSQAEALSCAFEWSEYPRGKGKTKWVKIYAHLIKSKK